MAKPLRYQKVRWDPSTSVLTFKLRVKWFEVPKPGRFTSGSLQFYAEALFCAHLHPFALFCGLAFALVCSHLRSLALICVFLRLTAFRTTAFGNCRNGSRISQQNQEKGFWKSLLRSILPWRRSCRFSREGIPETINWSRAGGLALNAPLKTLTSLDREFRPLFPCYPSSGMKGKEGRKSWGGCGGQTDLVNEDQGVAGQGSRKVYALQKDLSVGAKENQGEEAAPHKEWELSNLYAGEPSILYVLAFLENPIGLNPESQNTPKADRNKMSRFYNFQGSSKVNAISPK